MQLSNVRLADARFAHDGDELAGLDAERHVLEDGRFTVVLAEVGNAQRHPAWVVLKIS
jgi:hypothetical protein